MTSKPPSHARTHTSLLCPRIGGDMSEPQTMAPQLDPVEMAELLRRKLAGKSLPYSFIREVDDPSTATPEDLVHGVPAGTDRGEGKGVAWYLFWPAEWHGSAGGGSSSKRKRKVAASGETSYYWHPETGKQAIVAGTDGTPVGAYKRTLSYIQKIENPPGMATPFRKKRLGWKMLEVGLDDPDLGLVLCKLYRTHPALQTHPGTSTVPNVPSPAPAPAPAPAALGAEFPMNRKAIVRNGSVAAAAAVTLVIDLCGSSIPPTQRLKDLANNVRGLESPAVVVSAMGNSTTTILRAACKALRCDPEKVNEIHELMLIQELYLRTTRELGLETSTVSGSLEILKHQLQRVAMNKRLTHWTKDNLVSFGEIMATEIFYEYLNKLEGALQEWKLLVVTTSGKGSSNFSATTIDRALDLREIQVWKDVDGIFSCDPKVCADATLVPHLTFGEANELAEWSTKQVMEYGVSVRVRNPYKPQVPGTVITETRDLSESTLTSIVLKSNITMVDIRSQSMQGQSEIFTTEIEELETVAEVHRLEDRSVISLIGNAQKSLSIQKKALSVLWGINAEVYKFWQESSKVMKASLVVDRNGAEYCVQTLHSAFFKKVPETENVPHVPVYAPPVAVAVAASISDFVRSHETCFSVPAFSDVWLPDDGPYELMPVGVDNNVGASINDVWLNEEGPYELFGNELMPVGVDNNAGAWDRISRWAPALNEDEVYHISRKTWKWWPFCGRVRRGRSEVRPTRSLFRFWCFSPRSSSERELVQLDYGN